LREAAKKSAEELKKSGGLFSASKFGPVFNIENKSSNEENQESM